MFGKKMQGFGGFVVGGVFCALFCASIILLMGATPERLNSGHYITLQNGEGDMAWEFNPDGHVRILNIDIHFSTSPGSNNLTLTEDSATSTSYDVRYDTVAMSAITDYHYPAPNAGAGESDQPIVLHNDNGLDIVCDVDATTTTWGTKITWEYW